MAQQSSESPAGEGRAVRGQHIPKRRFTRWALYYFLLYVILPVLATSLALDAVLYFITTRFFDRCYALFCLFQ